LRILLICLDRLDSVYGGGQVYVKNLVAGLLRHQATVSYLSINFTADAQLRKVLVKGGPVKEYQLLMPEAWQQDDAAHTGHARIVAAISSLCREIAPNIIHAHGWKEYTCLAARQAGIPCVVTAHHGGIVCPAGALLNSDDEICQLQATQNHCLPCCTKSVPGWRFWYLLLKAVPLQCRLWLGELL